MKRCRCGPGWLSTNECACTSRPKSRKKDRDVRKSENVLDKNQTKIVFTTSLAGQLRHWANQRHRPISFIDHKAPLRKDESNES